MKISCSIPSSRDIPLSLNLDTPVVISEPKSAVAKQLQQLAQRYAPAEAEKTRKGRRRRASPSASTRPNRPQRSAARSPVRGAKFRTRP